MMSRRVDSVPEEKVAEVMQLGAATGRASPNGKAPRINGLACERKSRYGGTHVGNMVFVLTQEFKAPSGEEV